MKKLLRGMVFCLAVFACCTAAALVICGACGHEGAEGQRFCSHCGAGTGDDKPQVVEKPATATVARVTIDLQAVFEAARADGRAAAEIEEKLPAVALYYYRNASALVRLLPDEMIPDDSGKRLIEKMNRCKLRMKNTFKPCPGCNGAGRRKMQLRTLNGIGESDASIRGGASTGCGVSDGIGRTETKLNVDVEGGVSGGGVLAGEGTLCKACGGTGRVQAARTADELRLLLAQGVRDHETRQQAARRVAVGNVWAPVAVAEVLTPRLQALLRTAAASPCTDCQGLGIQTCGSCKGQGRTVCKNSGCKDGMIQKRQSNSLSAKAALVVKTPCPACNGSGLITCVTCTGCGHVVCRTCDGLGQPKKCATCGGAGTGACTRCKGTGKVMGKNRVEAPCTACGGEGIGLCPTCRGEGCASR